MELPYEIRDPVHGFIGISAWERDILNHPALQRLRRIRQLGLSDMVYPGSVHTRFEHSLGVMHVASRMFSEICKRSPGLLKELGYEKAGLDRQHALIRITALVHDVGHAPFSHAAEELMGGEEGEEVSHEKYTAGVVKHLLREAIEDHRANTNFGISVDEVTALLERKHFRRVFETPEVPSEEDFKLFEKKTDELGDMVGFVDKAQSSWYRQEGDPLIDGRDGVKRLSQLSTIVGSMKTVNRHRVYVRPSDREPAEQVVRQGKGGN